MDPPTPPTKEEEDGQVKDDAEVKVKDTSSEAKVKETGDGEDVEEGEEAEVDPPSFENVLDILGMPGRFQLVQIGVSLQALVVCCFMGMSIVFLGYAPHHECRKVNETRLLNTYGLHNDPGAYVTYKSCDVGLYTNQSGKVKKVTSLTCPEGRDFFETAATTYVSQWDLVCEAKGQAGLSHTAFTVGQIVGGVVSSFLADRFGRKPVIVVSTLLAFVAEAVNTVSPSIFVVYVVKFVGGLFYMSVVNSVIILGMELVAPRHRQMYGVAMSSLWICNILVVAGVAYLLRDYNWRYFQAIGASTGLLFLVFPFVLKESPRWLAASGRTDEALAILKIASRQNGKDFEVVKASFDAFIAHAFPEESESGSNQEEEKKAAESVPTTTDKKEETKTKAVVQDNFFTRIKTRIVNSSLTEVFRNKRILFLMVVAWYIWLTNILTYFGLFISSSTLAGDRFLNFVLMDLVEIPSNLLLLFLLCRFGRRPVLAFFMALTVLALLTSALLITFGEGLPGSATATTALFILGKFAISSSFGAIYIITPELFPTNIRSTASGMCNSLGRIGSGFAPFLRPLHTEAKWGPALLLTVLCSVAIVLIVFLPETKDRDLPNTVQEMMQQRSDRRRNKNKNKNKEKSDEGQNGHIGTGTTAAAKQQNTDV